VQRRSNLLVLIGVAAVIIGSAVVWLVLQDDDSGLTAGPDTVEVVVAKENLTSGMLGDDVISAGQFEVRRIPIADRQPDALTTPSQLSNQILNSSFAKGEQLRTSGLRPRSLLTQQVQVPAGFEAIAVSVDFVAGGGGYVAPGDKVNVFAVVEQNQGATQINPDGTEQKVPLPYSTPRAELLLTNVDVLDVSQQIAPARTQAASSDPNAVQTARPTGNALTVLLAVNTLDAEKVIFASAVGSNRIYLTRVNGDAPPAEPTEGQDPFTILLQEAVEAYQRAHPQ
jgi:Flp pilus assembly protein CpaB